MFKQLLELVTKQFIKKVGRPPQTAAEMMSIQNQVVNLINKTKGKIPLQKESKSPFQGFTPRVIEGGKGKAGIGTLLKDSPEAIAKIKAENKAAAERLRKKKLDEEPDDLASGGIAGQLHLNEGGRARFQTGGYTYNPNLNPTYMKNILAYDEPYWKGHDLQSRMGYENILDLKHVLGKDIGAPLEQEELKDYLDKIWLQSESQQEALKTSPHQRLGSGYPFFRYSPSNMSAYNMSNPLSVSSGLPAYGLRKSLLQLEEPYGKEFIKPYLSQLDQAYIDHYRYNMQDPDIQKQIFGGEQEATPTGIETIPGEKKSFNVMMNEKGNVMDDQSMAELARETDVAPDIQNYPIRSMSDVQRMIGPGDDISERTGYNMPPPSVEQRMQAAADKGMDARMGRTYAENIQAMADPRMRGAKGGIAGELHLYDGGRARFDKGKKVDLSKRAFLKGTGATLGVLSALPFVGKFFKPAAKIAKTKALTSVPIESATGMPDWYIPLINRVLKEGDDVTKKLGTVERELVHTKKINPNEEVTVYQNLDTGNVRVEYGPPLLDEQGRVIRATNDNQVVHLEYKAPETITEGKHAGQKTNPEFSAAEAKPRVVNWEGDIEWEHMDIDKNVGDLLTDTSPLKTFAKKKLTNKEKVLAKQKQQYKTKLEEDPLEQLDYIERKEGATIDDLLDEGKRVGEFDPKGYDPVGEWKGINLPERKVKKAEGGRVSLSKGGLANILGV